MSDDMAGKNKESEHAFEIQKLELSKNLIQVLKILSYRVREIIKLRYGVGDGDTYTFEEIGRVFGITPERVRQIETEAIRKVMSSTHDAVPPANGPAVE